MISAPLLNQQRGLVKPVEVGGHNRIQFDYTFKIAHFKKQIDPPPPFSAFFFPSRTLSPKLLMRKYTIAEDFVLA